MHMVTGETIETGAGEPEPLTLQCVQIFVPGKQFAKLIAHQLFICLFVRLCFMSFSPVFSSGCEFRSWDFCYHFAYSICFLKLATLMRLTRLECIAVELSACHTKIIIFYGCVEII